MTINAAIHEDDEIAEMADLEEWLIKRKKRIGLALKKTDISQEKPFMPMRFMFLNTANTLIQLWNNNTSVFV